MKKTLETWACLSSFILQVLWWSVKHRLHVNHNKTDLNNKRRWSWTERIQWMIQFLNTMRQDLLVSVEKHQESVQYLLKDNIKYGINPSVLTIMLSCVGLSDQGNTIWKPRCHCFNAWPHCWHIVSTTWAHITPVITFTLTRIRIL